jgi:hypothetical protein
VIDDMVLQDAFSSIGLKNLGRAEQTATDLRTVPYVATSLQVPPAGDKAITECSSGSPKELSIFHGRRSGSENYRVSLQLAKGIEYLSRTPIGPWCRYWKNHSAGAASCGVRRSDGENRTRSMRQRVNPVKQCTIIVPWEICLCFCKNVSFNR